MTQEGIDVAPGVVPGPRAARLQQLYGQSLSRTLAKLQWDNFAACYPTMAARAEPVLRQVQAQMVDKLREKCEKEFENIMAARQVVARLNELESLVGEASARRAASDGEDVVAPHTLPPEDILRAHLAPALASHQVHLNARLQTVQSRNAMLHQEVLRQRGEMEELLRVVEGAAADVAGANAVLGPVVDGMAEEARRADAEAGERLGA